MSTLTDVIALVAVEQRLIERIATICVQYDVPFPLVRTYSQLNEEDSLNRWITYNELKNDALKDALNLLLCDVQPAA